MAQRSDSVSGWNRVGLVAVKGVHTLAFFSFGSCLVYFAYAGIRRRSGRRAAIAGAIVTMERRSSPPTGSAVHSRMLLTKLTKTDEKRIAQLVKRAVS